MKILLLFPSLRIHSEWIYRLINNLENSIACIATNDINKERIRNDQVSTNPLFSKFVRKINEDLNSSFTYYQILSKIEEKYKTNVNYFHFIGFAIKFKKFIKNSDQPTLIHCHGKDIMWDLKDRKTGEPFHSEEYFQDLQEIAGKAYFIANSNFTKNQLLAKGIPAARIFINHFGIEPPMDFEKKENKIFKILYLGRLVDFKGPIETISAFEMASEMGMDAELIMAGGGEMEDQCRQRINQSKYKDRIKLLGWVDFDKARDLFKSADIFTAHNKKDRYTNQVEAFGVSILEAMSYGVPVITGDCGGVSDTVINGFNGYLIKPEDISEHAFTFVKLYQEKKKLKELGDNARLTTIRDFSVEKEKQGLKNILSIVSKN